MHWICPGRYPGFAGQAGTIWVGIGPLAVYTLVLGVPFIIMLYYYPKFWGKSGWQYWWLPTAVKRCQLRIVFCGRVIDINRQPNRPQ